MIYIVETNHNHRVTAGKENKWISKPLACHLLLNLILAQLPTIRKVLLGLWLVFSTHRGDPHNIMVFTDLQRERCSLHFLTAQPSFIMSLCISEKYSSFILLGISFYASLDCKLYDDNFVGPSRLLNFKLVFTKNQHQMESQYCWYIFFYACLYFTHFLICEYLHNNTGNYADSKTLLNTMT